MAGNLDIRLAMAGDPLSQDQLDVITENFRLLDRDKDGKLKPQEAGILYRALGQHPTEEELQDMLKQIPDQGCDVNGFIAFFSSKYKLPTAEDTLVQAFQALDSSSTALETGAAAAAGGGAAQRGNAPAAGGDGTLMSAEKFKELLTTLGEAMSKEEVDIILKEAVMDEFGQFDFKQLAQRLLEGPRIQDL